MALAYYNEHDPYAAQWLRNLISAGLIAPGIVDERSIKDVTAQDLKGYTQVHLFAGIGGWSYAARLAGWPDDRPLWSGSCPCQPFSLAGKLGGSNDDRHLWLDMYRLVSAVRPPVVVGEQMASRAGLAWLDGVCSDLEAAGYATGAADICAAGVGAPHIRQRLWWVAHAQCGGLQGGAIPSPLPKAVLPSEDSGASGVGHAECVGSQGCGEPRGSEGVGISRSQSSGAGTDGGSVQVDGFWRDVDWLPFRDTKWRPVEPGTFPLAHGVSARMGRLRGYGNAIVPQVAAEVLRSYLTKETSQWG